MKILINDERKLLSIQKEFNKLFPYLKLEFFGKPHKIAALSSKIIVYTPSKTVGRCRTIHNKGVLTITASMTVEDLAQAFTNVYGLSVRVLRKSGKAWLKTTITDNWTLEKQNKEGKALSKDI